MWGAAMSHDGWRWLWQACKCSWACWEPCCVHMIHQHHPAQGLGAGEKVGEVGAPAAEQGPEWGERVRCSRKFLDMAIKNKLNFLDNLVTMDEYACTHQQQLKQWLKRAHLAPANLLFKPQGRSKWILPSLTIKAWYTPRWFPKSRQSIESTL